MAIINEFYPSKHGRACHMDLGDVPKFVEIGFDVIYKGLNLKNRIIDSIKTSVNDYPLQEKISENSVKAHVLLSHAKEQIKENFVTHKANINKVSEKISDTIKNVYENKFEQLAVGCLASSLLLSSSVIAYQITHLPTEGEIAQISQSDLVDNDDGNDDVLNTINNTNNDTIDNTTNKQNTHPPLLSQGGYLGQLLKKNSSRKAHTKKLSLASAFKTKADAFAKILLVTEGKSKVFHKDNIGVATAYGWNPTTNPKEFNLPIAKAIGFNAKEQKAIADISAKPSQKPIHYVPANLKKIVLSEKQLREYTQVVMDKYEKEFVNVLKTKAQQKNQDPEKILAGYEKLPNNQQAVLLHMTYKVGAINLLKYNDFFDHLFRYINNPTTRNMEAVSSNFEYNYKTRNGELVRDTRVEKNHETFFSACAIDKNKPENKVVDNNATSNNKNKVTNNIQSCRDLIVQAEEKSKKIVTAHKKNV